MRSSDFERLEAIIPAVKEVARYNRERYELPKNLGEVKKKMQEHERYLSVRKRKDVVQEFLITTIVVTVIAGIILFLLFDSVGHTKGQCFFIALCMGGIVAIFFDRVDWESREKAAIEYPELKQKYEKLTKSYEEYQRTYPIEYPGLVRRIQEVIPEHYAQPYIIFKLYEYMKNQRADTLKDAINLYELEQHQQRVEETQRAIEEETLANRRQLEEINQRIINLENAPVERH